MSKIQHKPGDIRFSIQYIRCGQAHPYSRTEYEFYVFAERIPYGGNNWEAFDANTDTVRMAAYSLGQKWKDDGDWHEPKLSSMSKVDTGLWKFLVTKEYTD